MNAFDLELARHCAGVLTAFEAARTAYEPQRSPIPFLKSWHKWIYAMVRLNQLQGTAPEVWLSTVMQLAKAGKVR